jgi:hypothetical protein
VRAVVDTGNSGVPKLLGDLQKLQKDLEGIIAQLKAAGLGEQRVQANFDSLTSKVSRVMRQIQWELTSNVTALFWNSRDQKRSKSARLEARRCDG